MRLSRWVVSLGLVTLVTPSLSSGVAASSAAGCQTWQRAATPLIPDSYLTGVDGVSSNNVWAVGAKYYAPSQPPILHWNGVKWTGAPADKVDVSLQDVSADASNDAWAVGDGSVMHWDGSRWRLSADLMDTLYAVTAISPTDVWAVGNSVYHWDGTAWSLVPSSLGILLDVAAVSSNDVWGVGYLIGPLAEHWDGSSWTTFPVPSPPGATGNVILEDIAAISTDDIWATGYWDSDSKPLTEHWDGTAWSIVTVATPKNGLNLGGATATSPSDAWAVGAWRKVTLHWDGSSWKAYSFQAPSQGGFLDVSAISPTDVWAVGSYEGANTEPLIEHSNGPCP